ncbi:MAG TPA: hypothetical protein VHX38_01690 [Pseudonocardiaceae bacterium]|jgi:hypothetical protein|nr:hypothetical protein [Pseudonocardiaceae bacterium]
MVCAVCRSGLDHCHGTLVVHLDGGFAECTDERCADLDTPRHASVIDCASISGGCGCALPEFAVPEFEERLQQVS